MAAISSSLLAASAQTGNPTAPVATPSGGIDFASLLLAVGLPTQSSAATGQAPPATTALPEELAEAGESTDATAAAGVLVAGGLLTLPATPLPGSASVAATTAQPIPVNLTTALPTPLTTAEQVPATPTPVPPAEVAPTESRTEQLRLTTAPAARTPAAATSVTQQPEAALPPLPAELTADRQPAPAADRSPVRLPLPTTPTTTPADVATVAVTSNPRTQVVVPQVPVIAERSQQLPALPPEIGYSLVRPELTAPAAVQQVAEVGVGVSQAQIEATINQFTTAESKAPRPVPAASTAAAFDTVLASRTPTPVEPAAPARTPDAVPAAVRGPVEQAAPPVAERATADARPVQFTAVPLTQPDTPPSVAVPQAVSFPREASVGEPTEPTADAGRLPRADAVFPTTTAVGTDVPQAAPRVNAAAPPVAAQVSDTFVTHAQVLVKGGRHEFQLRLDPPELGEVQVRVLATGDRVEARLVVTDDAVKHLIESQLPELRQRLEAAGVTVPQFDVTTDSGGRATGDERWERPQPAFAPPPKSATPAARTPSRPTAAGGLIDVTA
jgi:flagellar hook-length control protein FliK